MREKRVASAPLALSAKRLASTPMTVISDLRSCQGLRSACRTRQSGNRVLVDTKSDGMEAIFSDVSTERPGLCAWRVEGHGLQVLDTNDFGFFYEGTCYIVLKVTEDKSTSLHFWIGNSSTKHEAEIVQDQAHELDLVIERAHIFSREVQGHESSCFLRLFPEGVVYLEGKPTTTVSRASSYKKRMYVIRGRKYVKALCCEPTLSSLDPNVSVVLDGFPRIYVWVGAKCSYVSRVKAIHVARRIRNWQRSGKVHVVVIDEEDKELNKSFLKKLDNGTSADGAVEDQCFETERQKETVVLHRVSGDNVLHDMPYAAQRPLQQRYLVKSDSYLLDTGPGNPLYVWVGSRASVTELSNAVLRGQAFGDYKGYPDSLPVCRILEGSEPISFKTSFSDWRDRVAKRRQLSRSYSVGNVGRALFSRSDRRTVAKLSEIWSDDVMANHNSTTETYLVKGESLWPLEWEDQGVFSNSRCYVILHQIHDGTDTRHMIYYWLGSKSQTEEQEAAMLLSLTMDKALNHQTVVMRVLDEKEPQHFLNVLNDAIIVYDKNISEEGPDTQLFSVTECSKSCMRVSQISASAKSLSSSTAFVLISPSDCFLWYGKESGGPEREYAKHILGYLNPSKMYTYDIVIEGKEIPAFWTTLGGKENYATDVPHQKLERRVPRLVNCSFSSSGLDFSDIEDFEQEDLCEDDTLVFDTFDQLFIWSGKCVDSETRKLVPEVAKEFLSRDQAGREENDLHLWFVTQGCEPETFTKYFRQWDQHGYGGRETYALARKRVRQENARIIVDSEVLDNAHLSLPKYSYRTLLKQDLPPDIDTQHKEFHLTDKQFREVLRVSRSDFYHYPEWKRAQILKSARLAHTHDPVRSRQSVSDHSTQHSLITSDKS